MPRYEIRECQTFISYKTLAKIFTPSHSSPSWKLVGNSSLMPALTVGDARTPWPRGMRMHRRWDAQAMRSFHAPLFFPTWLFSLHSFLPFHNFPQVFPFHWLIAISHDPHPLLIQTLCLHLSSSTPLRKTLTVDHYFHVEYFRRRGSGCEGYSLNQNSNWDSGLVKLIILDRQQT